MKVVEAEVVSSELAAIPETGLGQSFWSSDPKQMMAVAGAQADALADIIKQKGMSTRIGGKNHVNIEGWQTLGAMVGVFAVIEWTHELVDDEGKNLGWEARALATTAHGQTVGAAEAECRRTESTWKNRDSYALRSMAQTRAMSKALRGPLGFIVHIAGYSATPEEEMTPVMSTYQKVARYAIDIAGGKEEGKEAFLNAAAAIGLESNLRDITEEQGDRIIAELTDAFLIPAPEVGDGVK